MCISNVQAVATDDEEEGEEVLVEGEVSSLLRI
jgi:hypothetical protein